MTIALPTVQLVNPGPGQGSIWLPQTGMTQIRKVVLDVDKSNAGAQSVALSFDAIPQDFTNLLLYACFRVANATIRGNVRIQFNGDNGSNYDAILSETFDGGTPTTNSFGNAGPPNNIRIGNSPFDASANANGWTMSRVEIPFYSVVGPHKTATVFGICNSDGQYGAAAASGKGPTHMVQAGRWFNTAAITSIQINHSSGEGTTAIKAGSVFALYAF